MDCNLTEKSHPLDVLNKNHVVLLYGEVWDPYLNDNWHNLLLHMFSRFEDWYSEENFAIMLTGKKLYW